VLRRFLIAPIALALVIADCGCTTQLPFGGEPMPPLQVATFMKVVSPASEYDQPPKFVRGLAPTSQLSHKGQWGYAEIEFTVLPDGSTGEFRFMNTTALYFARQAGLAVQKWTFVPAKKNGQSVPVRVRLPFTFRS
jgi:TonB family protein